MVLIFSNTFSNISAMSSWLVLLVEAIDFKHDIKN